MLPGYLKKYGKMLILGGKNKGSLLVTLVIAILLLVCQTILNMLAFLE